MPVLGDIPERAHTNVKDFRSTRNSLDVLNQRIDAIGSGALSELCLVNGTGKTCLTQSASGTFNLTNSSPAPGGTVVIDAGPDASLSFQGYGIFMIADPDAVTGGVCDFRTGEGTGPGGLGGQGLFSGGPGTGPGGIGASWTFNCGAVNSSDATSLGGSFVVNAGNASSGTGGDIILNSGSGAVADGKIYLNGQIFGGIPAAAGHVQLVGGDASHSVYVGDPAASFTIISTLNDLGVERNFEALGAVKLLENHIVLGALATELVFS